MIGVHLSAGPDHTSMLMPGDVRRNLYDRRSQEPEVRQPDNTRMEIVASLERR